MKKYAIGAATVVALVLIWFFNADGEVIGREGGDASTGATTTQSEPTGNDPHSGLPWVNLSQLPPEAIDTLAEIDAGPPYRYDRDGITFENREGLLPDEEYGYYQEFTVETPGSSDRGARRIIWGLEDEFYYTDDHYESFARIAR